MRESRSIALPWHGFRVCSCPSLCKKSPMCPHNPAGHKPVAMVTRGDQDPQLHVEEQEDHLWTQGPVPLVVEIVHPTSASPSPSHRWKPHRDTWDSKIWDQACHSTQASEGIAIGLSRAREGLWTEIPAPNWNKAAVPMQPGKKAKATWVTGNPVSKEQPRSSSFSSKPLVLLQVSEHFKKSLWE